MAIFRPKYTDPKTKEPVESRVWWCEFRFGGRRYRESTKTTRKGLAQQYEERRRREIQQQYATGKRAKSVASRMRTVEDAVAEYCSSYDCPNHREKSIAWVKERTPHLERLLGSVSLLDVTEERVREYMRQRAEEGAGHRTINMELDCLARAMGSSWRELWPAAPKLEEPSDTGRALSPAEEGRLLGAAEHSKSPFLVPFIKIALLTGMRCGEIRRLQLGRLDMAKRELRVGRAKTPAGEGRGIPMSEDLYNVIADQIAFLERTFGPPQPGWYLFPFSDRVRPVDPTRPLTTIKTAWTTVRKAAGVECRLHDLRHTAATKLAENDTPEATMKALMGHMSRAMLERYSHIRMEAKRKAVTSMKLEKPISVVPKIPPKKAGAGGKK